MFNHVAPIFIHDSNQSINHIIFSDVASSLMYLFVIVSNESILFSHVAANIMDLFMFTSCAGTIYFANRDALKVLFQIKYIG